MIDIKTQAEEKEFVAKGIAAQPAIEMTLDRLLLFPLPEVEDESTNKLILLDETKEAEKRNQLCKAMVKVVGPGKPELPNYKLPYKAGDIVYVWPNNFEAPITLDGIGYLIYPERNILGKEIKKPSPLEN